MPSTAPPKTSPSAKRRELVFGRGLALAALGATVLAAALDGFSDLAAALRSGAPVSGIVWTRFEGQGRVVPPAVYALLYVPRERRLEIVSAPASSRLRREGADPASLAKRPYETLADVYGRSYAAHGDVRTAAHAMSIAALGALAKDPAWPVEARLPAFQLELTLPGGAGELGFDDIKDAVLAWRSHPLFWPRLIGRLIRRGPPQRLSRYDSFLLAWTLTRLDPERIRLWRMPAPEILSRFVAIAVGRGQTLDDAPPADGRSPSDGLPPTVEILNASGVDGVALKATKILRFESIDVAYFGNASVAEPKSRFIDRVGSYRDAKMVMRALGCRGSRVTTELENEPRASVSVILGEDYARCSKLQD